MYRNIFYIFYFMYRSFLFIYFFFFKKTCRDSRKIVPVKCHPGGGEGEFRGIVLPHDKIGTFSLTERAFFTKKTKNHYESTKTIR